MHPAVGLELLGNSTTIANPLSLGSGPLQASSASASNTAFGGGYVGSSGIGSTIGLGLPHATLGSSSASAAEMAAARQKMRPS